MLQREIHREIVWLRIFFNFVSQHKKLPAFSVRWRPVNFLYKTNKCPSLLLPSLYCFLLLCNTRIDVLRLLIFMSMFQPCSHGVHSLLFSRFAPQSSRASVLLQASNITALQMSNGVLVKPAGSFAWIFPSRLFLAFSSSLLPQEADAWHISQLH